MASLLSHPAVPIGLSLALGSRIVSRPLLLAGVVGSLLPDIDGFGLRVGIPYAHVLGHRGFTHSLLFAVFIALVGVGLAKRFHAGPLVTFVVLLLSTASHGFLDALTRGGLGVAFFSPFSNERFFLRWRLIEVSPVGISEFFSLWGLTVLGSELKYVWLPCLAIGVAIMFFRRKFSAQPAVAADPDRDATCKS